MVPYDAAGRPAGGHPRARGEEPVFDIRGAIDLHVHCGPEGIPRRFDAIGMARHVREAGLAGAVLKSHVANTTSWAELAWRATGVRLFGSITLNHHVLRDEGVATARETAALFRAVGAERVVLTSDLGQVHTPPPGDGLLRFAEALAAEGITPHEIATAMVRNPAALVGD